MPILQQNSKGKRFVKESWAGKWRKLDRFRRRSATHSQHMRQALRSKQGKQQVVGQFCSFVEQVSNLP